MSKRIATLAMMVTVVTAGLVGMGTWLTATATASDSDDHLTHSLEEFLDASYRELMHSDPDTVWGNRLADEYDLDDLATWTQINPDMLVERAALASEILETLRDAYPRQELPIEYRIHFDAYEWLLEDIAWQTKYPYWDYVIGMSSYGVHNLALELLDSLPIDDLEDAWAYVRRIEAIDEWMEQLLAVYRSREADGVIPPRYCLDMTLMELDMTVPPEAAGGCDPESLSVFTTFAERLNELVGTTDAEQAEVLSAVRIAIETNLVPAFRSYRSHVASLLDRATAVGVGDCQDGALYYTGLLSHYVTKPVTAEEIRDAGEAAVRELQDRMKAFASDVLGWPRSLTMAELEDFIVAANLPGLEGAELLREYVRCIAEVNGLLDEYFHILPESGLVITVDPQGAPAYYIEPPIDRSGPGQVVTSLVSIVSYTAYDEPVLMHHESIPGHHLQLGIARDLELPDFRRDLMSNVYTRHPLFEAYTEGWALYAEQLAAEMGVYEDDPLGQLCQMRLMLTRLVRLVVDTGINAFGWSWEEAAAYLEQETGRAVRTSEMIRYDAYPGQACGYGMGYLTIIELRQRAMEALGEAFDIKAFHDAILRHGPMPLSTLEWLVDEWIQESLEREV